MDCIFGCILPTSCSSLLAASINVTMATADSETTTATVSFLKRSFLTRNMPRSVDLDHLVSSSNLSAYRLAAVVKETSEIPLPILLHTSRLVKPFCL